MISWMVKVMLRLLGNGSLGCLVLVGIINKRARRFPGAAARRRTIARIEFVHGTGCNLRRAGGAMAMSPAL